MKTKASQKNHRRLCGAAFFPPEAGSDLMWRLVVGQTKLRRGGPMFAIRCALVSLLTSCRHALLLRIRDLRRADGAVEGERRLIDVVERHGRIQIGADVKGRIPGEME